MKRWILVFLVVLCSTASAQVTLVSPEEGRKALKDAQSQAPARPDSRAGAQPWRGTLLPEQFAGWVGAPAQTYGAYNAATLAGDDAPVLVEFGYLGAERRRYTRDGQVLTVDAIRLKDSSGSYGLYTYYRGEDWGARDTGQEQIAVRGNQVLARKEEVVARAVLEGSLSARLGNADVRELLAGLGTKGGGPVPNLPLYLPEKGLLRKTRKYVLGPAGLSRVATDVPAAFVDFEMGAEGSLARYQLPGKPLMTLLLVSYPTPQVAATKVKAIGEKPEGAERVFARRIGSLAAFVLGAPDHAEANRLFDGVAYSADLVWNQRVDKNEEVGFARFIVQVFMFIGALLLFAALAGLAFGWFRILVKKRYPGRVFDRPEETEIIRLNINYSK